MDSSYLECAVCMNRYEGKIFLCDTGHCLCESCSAIIKTCPKCNMKMTNKRNYDMEALVQALTKTVKIKCANNGCTYKLTSESQETHQLDCKYRMHLCQGAVFANWNCKWIGTYEEILDHFKQKHPNHSRLTAVTKSVQLQFAFADFKDTQLISFMDGKQLFYYKLKVDKAKQMVYWLFQFIGPAREAKNYTYEFEINRDQRKYKINGICAGDTEDCEELFDAEDCVCLTFKQIKHYLNDANEVDIRFRIGNFNHVPVKPADEKLKFDKKLICEQSKARRYQPVLKK